MSKILLLLFSINCYGFTWTKTTELGIDSSVPASLKSKIYTAASTLNVSIGYDLIKITDGCKGKNCIFYVKAWARKASEQAVTSVFAKGFDVVDYATIMVNAENFDWTSKEYDFESLILHEIGHFIGLDHSKDKNSVMYPYLKDKQIRQQLTNSDKKNIKDLYGK